MVVRIHLMSGYNEQNINGGRSCTGRCEEKCKNLLIETINNQSADDDPCTCYRNLGQCRNDAQCPFK